MAKDVRITGSTGLLSALLPRSLTGRQGDETATLLHALLTHAHLDRPKARAYGWRGVRPSNTRAPAWTARVACRDAVFGLVFEGETLEAEEALFGRFSVYRFPDPDDGLLARRAEAVRREVNAPEWPERVRALSETAPALDAYRTGEMELAVDLEGTGAALTFTALTQAPEGSPEDPGRVRPLSETLPFFTALAETFADALGDAPTERVLWAEREEGAAAREVSVTLAAGSFVGRLPGRRMRRLPFRHTPHEEESGKAVAHVLTGFLGSGKTTFLRQWLEYRNNRERFTGVIQNEFGEIDLDTLVLEGQTKVEAIDEGCVCCTLADSLRPGIERLLAATPADEIVIETTGLARASAVMDSLWVLNDLVVRGLLITTVDAYDAVMRPEILDFSADSPEAAARRDQIESADVLVCTKADAVEEEKLEALMRRLADMNPEALVVPAEMGAIPFGILDRFYLHALDRRNAKLRSRTGAPAAAAPSLWVKTGKPFGRLGRTAPDASPNAEGFERMALRTPETLPLEAWRALIDEAGPGLVRAKGVVGLEGHGTVLLQYAAKTLDFEPLTEGRRLTAMEADPSERFLVLIGRGLRRPDPQRLAKGGHA